jgi:Phage integrase family
VNPARVSWHSFHHTHATMLGEVGESLKTAQALPGHSDLETTLNVYTHPIPGSQRHAVEQVARILDTNGLKSTESMVGETRNALYLQHEEERLEPRGGIEPPT